MSCAYVVLAHHDAEQLARLGAILADESVFLHVDRRVKPAEAEALYDAIPNADRLPRYATKWASWGLVEAALAGLDRAIAETDASHVILMSGQDYPLHAPSTIDAFFSDLPGATALMSRPLPLKNLGPDGGMNRVRYWHKPILGRRAHLPVPRKRPPEITPSFGEQWGVLSREMILAIQEVRRHRPDIERFYKHVWIPDEGFIPTVARMTPHADAVLDSSVWFTKWEGAAHPAVLDAEDSGSVLAASEATTSREPRSAKLFARKFKSGQSDRLCHAIETRL